MPNDSCQTISATYTFGFSFSLTISISLKGQENLIYNGSLKVGPYQGNAMYYYHIVEGDTILDGPFQIQRSNLGALLEKKDQTFTFKGAFKRDFPIGEWYFQFGEFESDSITEVVGYQYKINVNGTQQETRGSLNKGRPNGKWTFIKNNIQNSEIAQTLFKSEIEFDNGIPQKNFRIENTEATLVGRFLRDGLAHDEWTLFSKNEINEEESWFFTNGRLMEIRKTMSGESKRISLYPNTLPNFKIINLDDQYLKVLGIQFGVKDNYETLTAGIHSLLSENAGYYKEIDTIFSTLGKSDFLPQFKVKVPNFPLDSLEKIQFESIKQNYRSSNEISQSFLNDTQLNILKLSDQNALFLYTAIETLTTKFINPLGKLVEYGDQKILTYVPREKVLAHLWPTGIPKTKFLELSNSTSLAHPITDLAVVQKLAELTATKLDSIKKVLNTTLALEKRQQEFVVLEEQMIVQIKNLKNKIDSANTTLPAELLNALKNIKAVADRNLSDYSNMKEPQAKLDLGRTLVSCFAHLEEIENVVLNLPEKKKEITNLYQDQIWNPFMANLMTEDVKKRITTPYEKIWLPYLINQVTTKLSCANAVELSILFSKTHVRMLELREEDTKKLERKLRREQDPMVIKELFNLQNTVLEEQ